MITDITSINNPTIKHIKALASKKDRTLYGEYTVEGIKSVNDAISAQAEIVCIVVSASFDSSQIAKTGTQIYRVPEFIIEKICDTKNPQGIMAVIKQKNSILNEITPNGLYLYCDNVQDPGNMGTLIRTADAAGFDGIILSDGCVELYNPKTVRSSMGSFFRMNIYTNCSPSLLLNFKGKGVKIYGGALCDNTIDYRDADFSGSAVVVVGNEANGISNEVLSLCTPVKIPIYGGAESLNVAVAAGILMYHAANLKFKNN